MGDYDFRDEVNVEVLGHLFEKSVAELEKLRAGGLFALLGEGPAETAPAAMQKSAERKRFGTYYTPRVHRVDRPGDRRAGRPRAF